jgi:3-dehydroquinate synthase
VHIGVGLFSRLARDLKRCSPEHRVAVISDSRVAKLYGDLLLRALQRSKISAELFRFPAGERSKTRETKSRLEDRLHRAGYGRDTTIVALGGGVTGDLAGYLAASWHRGVPLVQLPTSLLAMVDSSIGGKAGVNLPTGKNLIGAIHQPQAVYADISTLGTLSDRHFSEGLAEMIKAGVIADADFFAQLEREMPRLLQRRRATLQRLIARSVQIKASVVRRDERESGRRAILNFGHTIGHAIEALSEYRIGHGRAISIGMVLEAELAHRHCGFPADAQRRLTELLREAGLPTKLPAAFDPRAILKLARRDKKARSGRARYALPQRLGQMRRFSEAATRPAEYTVELPESELLNLLRSGN